MSTNSAALRLALASPGSRLRLVALQCSPSLSHRLSELGLVPGVELQVVQDSGGSLLVAIGDTRLALGRALAHTLLVTPLG